MSQIAALLLMYMNEEDAFWALSQLLTDQRHAMHGETPPRVASLHRRCGSDPVGLQILLFYLSGFFIPGFPKLQRFQAHHDQIISKLLPKLKKHLVSHGCTNLLTERQKPRKK